MIRGLFFDRFCDNFYFAFRPFLVLKLHQHAFLSFLLILLELNKLCLGKSSLNGGLFNLGLLLKNDLAILYLYFDALIFGTVGFFDLFVGLRVDNYLRRDKIRCLLFLSLAVLGPDIFKPLFLFFRVFFGDVDYILNEACISSSLGAVGAQVFYFLVLSHPPLYLEHLWHITNLRWIQLRYFTFIIKHNSLAAQVYSHPFPVNLKQPLSLFFLFLGLKFLSPSQDFNIFVFFFV